MREFRSVNTIESILLVGTIQEKKAYYNVRIWEERNTATGFFLFHYQRIPAYLGVSWYTMQWEN